MRPQRLEVAGAAVRVADGVQQKDEVLQAEVGVEAPGELDDLGVDGGVGFADRLAAKLRVLAAASRLRSLVAEGGREVVEAHGLGQVGHAVLEVGATDVGACLPA